jgi:hypothetical protein
MTSNELRKCIQAFQRTLDSIKIKVEAISEQRKTDNCKNHPEGPELIPFVDSEVKLPPAITSYYDSENNERKSKAIWKRIEVGIAFGGLIAVIAYVNVTSRTLSEVTKQATAVQQQTEVMRQQLVASERPWIEAELAPDGPIKFEDGGALIFFAVTMTNVGHSVAVNVDVEFGASSGTAFGTNQIEAVCSNIKSVGRSPGRGDTVFPGGKPLTRRFFARLFKADLMHPALGPFLLSPEAEDSTKRFAPIVFGCVDYQFDFAEGHHQTWFAYNVYSVEPSGRVLYPAKHQGNIPISRILMSKQLSVGHWAN